VCEILLESNNPARLIRIAKEVVRQKFLNNPDFLGAIADLLIDENCVDF